LLRARWQLAVLSELAQPGFMHLAPVLDERRDGRSVYSVSSNQGIDTHSLVDLSAPARRGHRAGKDILDSLSITFARQWSVIWVHPALTIRAAASIAVRGAA
jgi:hypothetical protein